MTFLRRLLRGRKCDEDGDEGRRHKIVRKGLEKRDTALTGDINTRQYLPAFNCRTAILLQSTSTSSRNILLSCVVGVGVVVFPFFLGLFFLTTVVHRSSSGGHRHKAIHSAAPRFAGGFFGRSLLVFLVVHLAKLGVLLLLLWRYYGALLTFRQQVTPARNSDDVGRYGT